MGVPTESNSHGIQTLLDTLREQGVEAGRQEATRLIEEAQARADWMLRQAREEAEQLRREAEAEAETLREAGQQALRLAFRDLCLTAKDTFSRQFAGELQTLVGEALSSPEILARLMLAAAGHSPLPDDLAGEALLPERIMGLDELRENPQALREGPLAELLAQVARRLLERGITLRGEESLDAGVRFVLDEGRIHVDLTDRALTDLLLRHLQPRFRALLEGVVA